MAIENFLSEFPPVSTEQWERSIRENITGEEYASRLIWRAEEGLAVKPYYRSEDLSDLHCLDAAPGEFPYVRGTRSTSDWRIREEVNALDPEEANRAACNSVIAGAEEVSFTRVRIESTSDLALIQANLNEIPIHFHGVGTKTLGRLVERLEKRPHEAGVSANFDPFGDLDFAAELLRRALPDFRPFFICADEFQENAAGAIEEVAFALSAGIDFFSKMLDRGLPIGRIASSVGLSFSMGPEFFIQIAKLRAFRTVWAQAVEALGGTNLDAKAVIHGRTSHWNKTVYDPHVNILRATTEAISAILGGADSVSVAPFDESYRESEESSRRLARNTQVILKREALLSRVADPLGGSYLIEVLTHSIASKAWKLFQELEAVGGYENAKTTGIISSVLVRRTSTREQAFAGRRRVLIGTNRFANATEKVLNHVDDLRVSAVQRIAQSMERIRLRTERNLNSTGTLPRILLAEFGDVKMRGARSQFVAEFLASAGLESHIECFGSPEQIASSDSDLIILCSSDSEYLGFAGELHRLLKERGKRIPVVIAGNPDTMEQLRILGITTFIHLRSDPVEVLSDLQRQIGIGD